MNLTSDSFGCSLESFLTSILSDLEKKDNIAPRQYTILNRYFMHTVTRGHFEILT